MGAHVEPVNNRNGAFSAWAPRASAGAGAAAAADEMAIREASIGSGINKNSSISSNSNSISIRDSSSEDVGIARRKFSYEARGILAMARWAAFAKEQACVCPVGSDRGNHRQDQAALTMTLATLGLREGDDCKIFFFEY